jgi:diguanylate cyclase (GGDEF)-like protein
VLQSALIRLWKALTDRNVPDTSAHYWNLAQLQIWRELIDLGRHYGGKWGVETNHRLDGAGRAADDPGGPLHGVADPCAEPETLEAWAHFYEAVNDRFGHPAGDRALRRVARLLRAALRQTDFLARFGGEEFVVLLPGTVLTGAVEVGERLRRAVADGPWSGEAVTVSIGAATLGPAPAGAGKLLRDADRALYRAKAAGRNRVCG